MSDLVKRDDVLDALMVKGQQSPRYEWGDYWELSLVEIKQALESVPSAEPKTRAITCSECARNRYNGGEYIDGSSRCPIQDKNFTLPEDGYCYLAEPTERRRMSDALKEELGESREIYMSYWFWDKGSYKKNEEKFVSYPFSGKLVMETEKANLIECEVTTYNDEKERFEKEKRRIWVPKSQSRTKEEFEFEEKEREKRREIKNAGKRSRYYDADPEWVWWSDGEWASAMDFDFM